VKSNEKHALMDAKKKQGLSEVVWLNPCFFPCLRVDSLPAAAVIARLAGAVPRMGGRRRRREAEEREQHRNRDKLFHFSIHLLSFYFCRCVVARRCKCF
jgi:hypothetical protein